MVLCLRNIKAVAALSEWAHQLRLCDGRYSFSGQYEGRDMRHSSADPSLSSTKQRILKKLLAGELANLPDKDSITPRPFSQDPSPLSFAQERLWFLHQLEPKSAAYNMATAVRLQGFLDVQVLEHSIQEIISRHAVLRTTFAIQDNQPVQVITPKASVPLVRSELRMSSEAKRVEEIQYLASKEAMQPFDLSVGPLIRVKVLHLGTEDHVLAVTMHHIISDGWSMDVFIREMIILYRAFLAGQASPLPDLPIQYADFSVWQRQWLSGSVLEAQLDYWGKHLNGAPTLLTLPTDRPRPTVQRFAGASYSFKLSGELLAQLHALRQREGVTLYMLLLTAFEVLLSHYSGQEDFCVGTPVANRKRQETESLIGFFVNTLVIRANVSGDPSVKEMVQRVREVVVGAQEYQDLPFATLVGALQPERNLSYSPLFQVMFGLQNIPPQRTEPPDGLTLSPVEGIKATAQFDLSLEMGENGEVVEGMFHYNTDLFEDTTIERMYQHYQRVLEEMVAKPKARLSELSLLTESEREQVVIEWNTTDRDYPQEQLIHELFEVQAAETPRTVAVVCEEQAVTYAELNRQTNALAHYLRSLGVGPEILVGICLERSVDMAVGLLGILKAGGAYVPLDPEYPEERLAFMVADAGVTVVLTHEALRSRLPADAATVVCLDTDWATISQALTTNPHVSLVPENLAYAIYTSGSTGQPKGVGVPHAGLLNRIQWMQEAYSLTANDRVLQKTPFSFDVSVWEFFWPLMTGARLVMAAPGEHRDPERLKTVITTHGVTTLHFVPSMLHTFLETTGLGVCKTLRQIFCSGEALSANVVEKVFEQLQEVDLYNLYGPTESSIDVMAWQCEKDAAEIPIGRPIANTQIYVLDRQGQPVPVGVIGELHIGGIGVARGYRNRPELTAEKFVPNPFCTVPGTRLYKTGDLVRHRADGTIAYVGRVDHQVKIRGFRIELGEIETHLRRETGIQDAVVVARDDSSGNRRLVGYVVLDHNVEIDLNAVKGALKNRLPAYMVPGILLALDVLPLTSNGKVDRKALPAPDISEQMAARYVAPRTSIEKILSSIEAEVLRVEQVGIHDNFFELGGDSILSIQVITRVRQAGLVLTPRQFFQHQTVAELAAVASQASEVRAEQGLVIGDLPLTPIQQWLFEQSFPNPHHFNQAVLLEATQPLNFESIKKVVKALIHHHDALRARFVYKGELWRQSIVPEIPQDVFVYVDLSTKPEDEQGVAIEAEATKWQASLHLSDGPLLRVVWFDVGKHRPPRLLMIIHHLVIDGVSWRILLEDLQTGYRQSIAGQEISLPAKTTSWKEWAERLQAFAGAEGLQNEFAYWLDPRWANIRPLPVEYSTADATDLSMKSVTVSLGVEETQALLQDVPAAYGTRIDEVLLTALAQTLGTWADCTEIAIDLEGHGREDLFSEIDLSRTVGWFTSVYPVLLHLEKDMPIGEALKAVKDQLRRIPNRGIGYGILRYLGSQGDARTWLTSLPSPQVRFNYLGQFDQIFAANALFKLANESAGLTRDGKNQDPYVFDINITTFNRRLNIAWSYDPHQYRHKTIEGLGSAYVNSLNMLINHCLSPEAGGYTPSDFPDIDVDQETLDRALEEIEQ